MSLTVQGTSCMTVRVTGPFVMFSRPTPVLVDPSSGWGQSTRKTQPGTSPRPHSLSPSTPSSHPTSLPYPRDHPSECDFSREEKREGRHYLR